MQTLAFSQVWLAAARPKTLPASLSPVLIGAVLAWPVSSLHALSFVACLSFALLIQVATNFTNDYCDFVKGADTEERLGPLRVMQAGLVSATAMRRAIFGVFALASLVGLYLIFRGGWPFLFVLIASLASGVLYTAGPYALAYLGLGDVFVLVFFGPVAVLATYYLQTFRLSGEVFLLSLPPGLLATALLVVNNYRDRKEDEKSGKRTLAVRLGRAFCRWQYAFCLVLSCVLPLSVHFLYGGHPFAFLPLCLLPQVLRLTKTLWTQREGKLLNDVLASTGKLLILYTFLFSIGWLI